MAKLTRFQAVRAALLELGGTATNEEVARYVAEHHGYEFPDASALALYVSMVNSKMNRKTNKDKMPSKPEF
jgi:hypothetical protein